MNNRQTNQLLRQSRFDDTELEEISRRFPALDRSEINEIAALCEERLNMNEKNELYENHDPDTVDTVEVRKKTALFRHPAFTAAASLIILIGTAGAVIAGISRKNSAETSMSAVEPPAAVTQITTDPEDDPVVTTGSEITTKSAKNTSQKKTQTTAKVTEKAVSSVTTTGIVSDPKAGSENTVAGEPSTEVTATHTNSATHTNPATTQTTTSVTHAPEPTEPNTNSSPPLTNIGENKKPLTELEFLEILTTKDEYTWSDFEQYKSEDIGSGFYILKYEILDEDGEYIGDLYLSGGSMTEKPQNIYFEDTSGEVMDIYELK